MKQYSLEMWMMICVWKLTRRITVEEFCTICLLCVIAAYALWSKFNFDNGLRKYEVSVYNLRNQSYFISLLLRRRRCHHHHHHPLHNQIMRLDRFGRFARPSAFFLLLLVCIESCERKLKVSISPIAAILNEILIIF